MSARAPLIAAATIILVCCDAPETTGEGSPAPVAEPASSPVHVPAKGDPKSSAAVEWKLQSSGGGLTLFSADGTPVVRISCAAEKGQFLVNVPEFRPIGSEERLSFGSGGAAVTLVADSRGDARRGGVSGTGAVPDNLAALMAGRIAVSYGAQASGPHPSPAPDVRSAFVASCSGKAAADKPPATAGASSPCSRQGAEQLRVTALRAVGTEPFWGARIDGRCVTYSHPEDQQGTRIWTRYTEETGGGTWTGTLDGRPFRLRTQAEPGCSDGMSDKRYPIAVTLTVNGEERSGCAEPI